MKLKDFVKQTLLDITNGVSEAQNSAPLWIAPGRVEGEKVKEPQMVNFEVIVITGKEGGGSISVWSAKAGAKANMEHTNRISFSVPIYLQAPKDKKGDPGEA